MSAISFAFLSSSFHFIAILTGLIEICEAVPANKKPYFSTELNLILYTLGNCSLLFLSVKTVFLEAISSARKWEIHMVAINPSYIVSFMNKVSVTIYPRFYLR